ncbi:hypothetical protein QZH41_011549 [Actinostola sp. cb2023]|nr:hypothetical protein QZH41_011549 [Actinostola sp. cb2023]
MHACTITDLSDEILVRIFSFLSAREICRCSKVCSWWCRLANDFHLCSVLDIQLKQEAVNESWSVSISHAAEVMENWNLIGFQSVKFQGMNLTNFDCTINLPETNKGTRSESIEKNTKYLQENHLECMNSRAFISCLSISPCTKLVTSGQNDNTISLWDTNTKMRRHTLFGHTGSVTCTDVDRHKIVSGSNDRTVKFGFVFNPAGVDSFRVLPYLCFPGNSLARVFLLSVFVGRSVAFADLSSINGEGPVCGHTMRIVSYSSKAVHDFPYLIPSDYLGKERRGKVLPLLCAWLQPNCIPFTVRLKRPDSNKVLVTSLCLEAYIDGVMEIGPRDTIGDT